jgi:hypothetical protein
MQNGLIKDYLFFSIISGMFAIAFLGIFLFPLTYCVSHQGYFATEEERVTCDSYPRDYVFGAFSLVFTGIAAISIREYRKVYYLKSPT